MIQKEIKYKYKNIYHYYLMRYGDKFNTLIDRRSIRLLEYQLKNAFIFFAESNHRIIYFKIFLLYHLIKKVMHKMS